jgi:hypothetical protein
MVTQVGTKKNDDFFYGGAVLKGITYNYYENYEAFSNKNPGADEDFPLLYILDERLRDKELFCSCCE